MTLLLLCVAPDESAKYPIIVFVCPVVVASPAAYPRAIFPVPVVYPDNAFTLIPTL